MTDRASPFASAILMSMLDKPEGTRDQKHDIRNTLIPIIEFMDKGRSPEETCDNMFTLIRFAALALSYGIVRCARPDGMDLVQDLLIRQFEASMRESLGIVVNTMREEK